MTPEEQMHVDMVWLESEIREADALGNDGRAQVYRRILAALSARQEPFGWYVQRLSDGSGTLVFREPAHPSGTHIIRPLYTRPSTLPVRQEPSPDDQTEREMQEAWTRDLEEAVADAIHTLQTEVDAGTAFSDPGWVAGTLALLKRVTKVRSLLLQRPSTCATPVPEPARAAQVP